MRYCPNDDCPDFVAIGFRQDFTSRTSVCPVCGTHLVEGDPPTEEVAPPVAMERPSFDSPVPGILGGSPTGSIQPGESETLCQSCAAPRNLRGCQTNAFGHFHCFNHIFGQLTDGVVNCFDPPGLHP